MRPMRVLITIQPALKEAYILRLQLTEARDKQPKLPHHRGPKLSRIGQRTSTRAFTKSIWTAPRRVWIGVQNSRTQAEVFVSQNPWDGSARTTLALAR